MHLGENFWARVVSGAVYVLLILLPFFLACEWLFGVIFAFFFLASVIELNRLTRVNRTRPLRTTLDALFAVWMLWSGMLVAKGQFIPEVAFPLLIFLMYTLLRSLFSDHHKELLNIGNSLLALTYIGVPAFLTALTVYCPRPSGGVLFCSDRLIALFLIVWISDSAAYLVGSLAGKRPLWIEVSPHKTVEGLCGGLGCAAIVACFFPLLFPHTFAAYHWFTLALYGLIVAAAGVLGDLFQSMLKRRAGVKDAGNIIPGHGGILDRLDSYLFALPAAYALHLLATTL